MKNLVEVGVASCIFFLGGISALRAPFSLSLVPFSTEIIIVKHVEILRGVILESHRAGG